MPSSGVRMLHQIWRALSKDNNLLLWYTGSCVHPLIRPVSVQFHLSVKIHLSASIYPVLEKQPEQAQTSLSLSTSSSTLGEYWGVPKWAKTYNLSCMSWVWLEASCPLDMSWNTYPGGIQEDYFPDAQTTPTSWLLSMWKSSNSTLILSLMAKSKKIYLSGKVQPLQEKPIPPAFLLLYFFQSLSAKSTESLAQRTRTPMSLSPYVLCPYVVFFVCGRVVLSSSLQFCPLITLSGSNFLSLVSSDKCACIYLFLRDHVCKFHEPIGMIASPFCPCVKMTNTFDMNVSLNFPSNMRWNSLFFSCLGFWITAEQLL